MHCKNTIISPNFLLWKFCGKAQFPHSFGRFAVYENCVFPQNFHTRNIGEITVFFAVIFITLAIARVELLGREGLLSFHRIPTLYLHCFLVVVCLKISKDRSSSLGNGFGSNGDSVLSLSTSQNISSNLVRISVEDESNLSINARLRQPLPPNKTHPSFVLMPMGSPAFPCQILAYEFR